MQMAATQQIEVAVGTTHDLRKSGLGIHTLYSLHIQTSSSTLTYIEKRSQIHVDQEGAHLHRPLGVLHHEEQTALHGQGEARPLAGIETESQLILLQVVQKSSSICKR